MKVVVVAHMQVGKRPYLGLVGFDGRYYRTPFNAKRPPIGQVLDIQQQPAPEPPHQNTIRVTKHIPHAPVENVSALLEQQLGLISGPLATQFDGLTQKNDVQARFVSAAKGMPAIHTIFWQLDKPLRQQTDGKRTRYRYDDGTRLPYIGTAAPIAQIPAKSIICLTLAPWWQPRNQPEVEPRCYIQIAGWYDPPPPPASKPEPFEDPFADMPYPDDVPPPFFDDPFPMEEMAHMGSPSAAYGDAPPLFEAEQMGTIKADWTPVTTGTPHETLKQVFGYDEFRPLQQDIITNVLNKQDTLAIMPTGQGKSLCYQLPALHFAGLTIVVSPLISLMIDQVQQLHEVGVEAATLNSSMTRPAQQQVIQKILHGRLKLLYISPESLLRPQTIQLLSQCQVDCFTIDEAHCISAWGHDFRPEYRQLMSVRERFPAAVCLALTATATERVRDDITDTLGIPNKSQFIASFDRPNLHLSVALQQDAWRQVTTFLQAHKGSAGIIYCPTRKQVDSLTEQLTEQGYPVLPYHAGLSDQERQQNQTRFIYEEGLLMVATVAFGMGINKPNVRYVLHYGLPKNIESYYQQIGRAGRDSLPAHCLMIFGYGDIRTIRYFIDQMSEDQQRGARIRLDALIGYAEAAVCRRRPLLAYFAETYPKECGDMCDNCQDDTTLVDLTEAAQKFLSCVKRTGERFGMSHVIDVLRGSNSQKITERGHNQLSTYGIGREFSKKEWQYLGRQFLQQGFLVQDQKYATLSLSESGFQVMQGDTSAKGKLPEREVKSAVITRTLPTNYDSKLYELVRQKRTALAREANLPPYVIFSDRTLVDMAIRFPQSKTTFGRLYGVGQAKLDKYADIFLPIIQTYCQEHGLAEISAPAPQPTKTKPGGSSRTEEVWQAYQDGRSVAALADDYGVKTHTILNHLWKSVQAGQPLRQDKTLLSLSSLTAAEQEHALTVFRDLGADLLRPVYDALGEKVTYSDLHILRLYITAEQMAGIR